MHPVQDLQPNWCSVYPLGVLPLVYSVFSSMQRAMPAAVMLSGLKLLGVVSKQAGYWANAHFPLHLHKLVDTKTE